MSVPLPQSLPSPLASTPVPRWRSEPYRLFFPLGGVLAAAGVIPWLLFALGLNPQWQREAHAIIEIQGFLTAFAAGFLFTFVPRRLKAPMPAAWEVAPVLIGLVVLTALAWVGLERWAHVTWATVMLLIFAFAARRMLPALRRRMLPTAFAWIPVSLFIGVLGALAAGLGTDSPRAVWLGANLVWQGLFGGLIVGIGVLLLPVMTRKESWPSQGGPKLEWLLHGSLAIAFFLSFPLELYVPAPIALAVRGSVALLLMVGVGRIWRYPNMPGLHRRVAWISAWLFPLGYLGAALVPTQRVAMLHLTFVGGFALLTLAVGNHVLVAHTGNHALLGVAPRRIAVFAAAVVFATVARMFVGFDPERFRVWLFGAAALLIVGVLFWGSWILPRLHATRR